MCKRKTLSILIALSVVVLATAVLPARLRGSDFEVVSTSDLEEKFTKAQAILYDLLLPNTMARTASRTIGEEEQLLDSFQKIAAFFKRLPNLSVPFLASMVVSTPPDHQDPAFCALQLLFEINNQSSWKEIQKAQTHPYEVVSRLAKGMVKNNQDALWGFRSQKKIDNEIKQWDSVLQQIVPKKLRNIRVVKESDIRIYKEYGKKPKDREFIYIDNLAAYKNGNHLSFLRGDFNSNGKEDIALACLNPSERNSYLIILEKENNNYLLVKYIKFKTRIFFIHGYNNEMINLSFQSGTDWTEQVYWDGKKYVLKPADPYRL